MLRFLFLLLPLFLFSEEIRVALETEKPLYPTYIGKIVSKNSAFSPAYHAELSSIFTYDFAHNSSSSLLAHSPEKEQQISQVNDHQALDLATWKNWGAAFVVRLQLTSKELVATTLATDSRSLKKMASIELSGKLADDRTKIHKLTDAIYKTFFHEEGVASTKLLFAKQVRSPTTNESTSEIWECDWDGGNMRQVTHENSYCINPIYLPHNSTQFLYVSYKLGQPKIQLASLQTGRGERVIDLRGNQLLPAISHKKDQIAFISDAAGRPDLFLQPINTQTQEAGKPIQLFSYPQSTQASPTFSPDGSTIAFVSDKDSGKRIYTISTKPSSKRSETTMLTKINRENTCPSWSPDGTKLAYSAKTNGIRQIWIYDFALKEEVQLTTGPGHKENPCWAPNSRHLVFNSTDGNDSDLYIVNINQPTAIKITKGLGKKHYPAWSRN